MCSTCSVRIMEAITEGQPGHQGAVDTVLSLGSWVTRVLWTQRSPWGVRSLGCCGHSALPGESGLWGAVDIVLSLGSQVTGVLWTQCSPWRGNKTLPPGSGHRASEQP